MEKCFAALFEDVRRERSMILLISLTVPDILKQSKFADHVIIIKKLASKKVHRQRKLDECVAVQLLE